MVRKRNSENSGLPARWRLIHGAYYYRVPAGLEPLWGGKKQFRLGATLPEAYQVWAERIAVTDQSNTVGQLFDRYLLEVVPLKAPKTQIDNKMWIANLRKVFGELPLRAMTPQLVYKYHSKRTAKTAAKREIEILSHAFTKAVEWGDLDRHPLSHQVRIAKPKARTRYVEDWEIVECLAMPNMRKKGSVLMVQAYIKIKLLTGMRRSDMLLLKMRDIRDDGIHVEPHKTANSSGKRVVYQWSPELRAAIDEAIAVRNVDIAPTLFATLKGECYFKEATGTAKGWDKVWNNFMARVMAETKVTERFTEHDLRAKCASDAETLEHARQLLAHSTSATTQRIYRRRPEKVAPLR